MPPPVERPICSAMASLLDPAARGRVILVGAGPGDPGLLTVRAVDALARADVVIHDGLIDPRVLDLAPASAQRISVALQRSAALEILQSLRMGPVEGRDLY